MSCGILHRFVPMLALVASTAHAATIEMRAHAWTDNPDGLNQMVPGDTLRFMIGVSVIDDGSNAGLATMVYDVESPQTVALGYQLNVMRGVASGYDNYGSEPYLHNVHARMYAYSDGTSQPFYNGGWGFDTAGVPTGGNVVSRPGAILGAGIPYPLVHIADVNPNYPGLQPSARLGVGHGLYTFPDDDPILGGLQGGFGQDLTNTNNIVEGDGTWVFQESSFDTSGWIPQQYTFDVMPTNAAVLNGSLDYTQDIPGGFRVAVPEDDMAGASFQFTLIPEPETVGVILLAGLLVSRRRPH